MNKYKNKKDYPNTFTEYQNNILATVDFNGDKRNKVMSLLGYIIKHSVKGALTKSINKLYKMYIRYHYKISNKYFYNLVDTLVELNLLSKENNIITLVQEKVQKKVQTFKVASDVENTSLEGDSQKPKYKGLNNIYNYNIYNTNGVVYSPQINDTIADKNSLLEIAEDLFKLCKIRSKFIKTDVIDAIVKMSGKIYRKSARQYILSIIADKRDKREKERSIWAFIGGMQKYNKCNVNTGYNFNHNSYSAICEYENSLLRGV